LEEHKDRNAGTYPDRIAHTYTHAVPPTSPLPREGKDEGKDMLTV